MDTSDLGSFYDTSPEGVERRVERRKQAHENRMAGIRERNLVGFNYEDGVPAFVFNAFHAAEPDFDIFGGAPYEIMLRDVSTPQGFVHQLYHLRDKQWYTPQIGDDFLYVFHHMSVMAGTDLYVEREKWNFDKLLHPVTAENGEG